MKRYLPQILIVLWFACLSGCVTPYEPTGLENTAGLLVVEGMILEPEGTWIKLSRTVAVDAESEPYVRISNATVDVVCSDGQVWRLKWDAEKELYLMQEALQFDMNQTYAVEIQVDNKQYRSEFMAPIRTPEIDELTFALRKGGEQVDIRVSTHDPNNEVLYYRWDCEEDWEYVTANYTSEYWDPDRREIVMHEPRQNYYYCWSHAVAPSFALGGAGDRESATFINHTVREIEHQYRGYRFSHLYSALIKQYGIDKQAHTYYSQLKKHIEEMGSIFAPQPTELKGNIQCLSDPTEKVVGYVITTTETKKRIFIPAEEAPQMAPRLYCGEEHIFSAFQGREAYEMGLGIARAHDEIPNTYIWVIRRCVDCREMGGSKNKPSWWPNDHQ